VTDAPTDPLHRYHRQMLLDHIGRTGQERLAASHAAIIGCGALGSGVADLLARAGVGTLTIIDRDVVEPTNLQRQVLFDERHLAAALPKAEAARQRIGEINSSVRVMAHVAEFSARTVEMVIGRVPSIGAPLTAPSPHAKPRADGADLPAPGVLIDGTDNFETRLLINDLAVSRRIPYVYAGVLGTRGMVLALTPWLGGPCLRCLVDRPPAPGSVATCDTAGVLGPAVAHATSLQATEAIKALLGRADLLSPDLVEFDLWTGVQRRVTAAGLRDPACACCGRGEFEYLAGRGGAASATLCGRGSVQVMPATQGLLDLSGLAARLALVAEVTRNPFLVRAVLQDERGERGDRLTLTIFRDGRVIVSGTSAAERARGLVARYIGA